MQSNKNSDKRRYAIYGGSFDPIHNGHVALADAAVRQCGLDELIFMPAFISPFKQNRKVTDGIDRVHMIEACLDVNPAFSVSDYELLKGGPSYTVETLRHFRDTVDGQLCFVLGFDSVIQLDMWYHGKEILTDYPLITVKRPHTDDIEGMHIVEMFRREYNSDITVLDMPPVDASSTLIRRRIKNGEPISDMVHPGVEEYIIKHDLYKD